MLKTLLLRLLPASLVAALRELRGVAPHRRGTYARLRALRALGRRRDDVLVARRDARRVLVVCYGNIMRSPMAAALLARRLEALGAATEVTSAGTDARPGRIADNRALAVATECGVALDAHRAQPVTETLMRDADLVVAMDHLNESELVARFPWAADKVVLLGAFAAAADGVAIPDPYVEDLDTLRRCYARIDSATRELAGALVRRAHDTPSGVASGV